MATKFETKLAITGLA